MITFEVPNLDSIDPNDLNALRAEYVELSDVAAILAIYCACKEHAMRYRLKGDIATATIAESACEKTYNRLPQWAKW